MEGAGMRIIGLDIHRAFAEAVAWDDGKLRRLGRVDTAYSGDGGQAFHLKADSDSGRWRTAFR
jgi:hypothetical protein